MDHIRKKLQGGNSFVDGRKDRWTDRETDIAKLLYPAPQLRDLVLDKSAPVN